ncbi:MAG: quinolinate synthase [Negativicutes bacterium]|jgi:quinolinate synthase
MYKEEILSLKQQLGDKLLLLAHYYQHDDVYYSADVTGDSYQLAVTAAKSTAKYVVMCGVSFMADTVKLLVKNGVRVFSPDMLAGCPMAAMIDEDLFRGVYGKICECTKTAPVPVLYVNSTLATKAAVGEAGGLCCTSSNAKKIARQLLAEGKRLFFLPDKNLAINVAAELGIAPNEICMVDRNSKIEDINPDARLFVWYGFCITHRRISVDDVRAVRAKYPGAKIIAHPECEPEVITAIDYAGSTSQLLKYFMDAPSGATIIVGTELKFVERLPQLRSDVQVFALRQSACVNMAQITPERLRDCLKALVAVENGQSGAADSFETHIDNRYVQTALLTLNKMISETER